LLEAKVICHPFIVGELACGGIKNRNEILSLLQDLPQATVISQEEFLYFIDSHELIATGIGFVDVHLLASSLLLNIPVWTQDKRLRSASEKLGVCYKS